MTDHAGNAAPVASGSPRLDGPGLDGALQAPEREERVLYRGKPSAWFVVLRPAGAVLGLLGLAALSLWVAGLHPGLSRAADAFIPLVALAVLVVVWTAAEWAARDYVLTDRRVSWQSGVLRRLRVEVPLRRVQHAVLYRSVRERLFGLGTLGFASAGTDAVEVVWAYLSRPDEVYALVAGAIEAETPGRSDGRTRVRAADGKPGAPSRVAGAPALPVIGIAGGIGAGKSEVARAFERLGCLVLDSDAAAKAALDRPDVRPRLVEWWGSGVLGSDGRVDRAEVAAIVFKNPEDRRRLEALVHPLVRATRADAIAHAASAGAVAAVIDAPLLFEAGVDRECDAIVFVDAPLEDRLARVRERRGWSEGELARREAAQMPLDEKRRRAGFVLTNTGTIADLESRVIEILRLVLAGRRAS